MQRQQCVPIFNFRFITSSPRNQSSYQASVRKNLPWKLAFRRNHHLPDAQDKPATKPELTNCFNASSTLVQIQTV